ncbi:unnamed protein product [Schistosoma margrebowiei]|uniref:Uncharacterized protein n=1 Tax=Schistosoma margrebowiei TaxID=48269 RepID=A0A183M6J3_9TREM|nr:unnamed protein product [Schistosoma margrebowiei]
MFQFFINALNTQNEELKMLRNKVTELERANSEILDFVHKNGRLPEIVSRPICILLLKINEQETLELASNKDDISVYRGSESNHGDRHQQLEIRESSDTEPKARFEHDLDHIKTSLSKLLPDTVSGVSICKLYRIEKKVDSESPQKNRLLKVTFNTVEERNLILSNSRKLIGSGIYVREDLSLADRIKRRDAEAEINERRRNGERNLVLKGFQIVKVRSKTIPKPLWVARESSPQT